MMPGSTSRAGLLALGLIVLGGLGALPACATTRRFTAPRGDYVAYRDVRTAQTPEHKLQAADHYLRKYPDGAFRSEVQAWFASAEPEFVRQAYDRPSMLRAYQRALPHGPHEKQVSDRLVEFELWNAYRARQVAKAEGFLSRVERDLELAEASRREYVGRITNLVRLISDARSFGVPTPELDHELIYEFRLRPPAGSCSAAACVKDFDLSFAVPHAKRLQARTSSLRLGFQLEHGRVTRFGLSGPDMFTRLAEASDRTYVDEKDLLARTEAIARSVQILGNALEPHLPAAECERSVVAPVVLERQCRGVLLRALAAEGTDTVEVRPAPANEARPSQALSR